jgi:LPXTG-motif cell wall-anchored protein
VIPPVVPPVVAPPVVVPGTPPVGTPPVEGAPIGGIAAPNRSAIVLTAARPAVIAPVSLTSGVAATPSASVVRDTTAAVPSAGAGLPATGSSSVSLTLIAVAMMAVGALLVVASKRQGRHWVTID